MSPQYSDVSRVRRWINFAHVNSCWFPFPCWCLTRPPAHPGFCHLSASYHQVARRGESFMRMAQYVCAAVSAALCVSLDTSSLAAGASAPLATGLRELAAAYDRGDPRLSQKLQLHLTDRTGDPLVKVRIMPGADSKAVLADLASAGFRLQTQSTLDRALGEGVLPLAAAHKAAAVTGVHSIHAEHRPMKHVGLVTSQAVALEKADLAQKNGFDGKGIRIAALSDSYDACTLCATHAADDIKTGDLPKDGV